jgi:hypothetical protein
VTVADIAQTLARPIASVPDDVMGRSRRYWSADGTCVLLDILSDTVVSVWSANDLDAEGIAERLDCRAHWMEWAS